MLKIRFTEQHPMPFQLLETLRWDPRAGFLLLSPHLARLEQSARFFVFRFDYHLARAKLEAAVQNAALLKAGDALGAVAEVTEWRIPE